MRTRKPKAARTRHKTRWQDDLPWDFEKRGTRFFAVPDPARMDAVMRAVYGRIPTPSEVGDFRRAIVEGEIYLRPLILGERAQNAPVLRKTPHKLPQFLAANPKELQTQRWDVWTPYRHGGLVDEPVVIWSSAGLFGTPTYYYGQKCEANTAKFSLDGDRLAYPLEAVREQGAVAFWETGSRILWLVVSDSLKIERTWTQKAQAFPDFDHDAQFSTYTSQEGAA